MPERNLAIRLSVMDGGKVKAELKEIGESGEKSLKQIELAGKGSSSALKAINAVANDVKESAVGMTHEMGAVGSALLALGPAGIAAGAALAVVTLGIHKGIEEAMEAEQVHNRLQAVLRATGNASGLTAKELTEFSDKMEESTLVTHEQVLDAAAVMATFRSVSGESFTRALSLAQDLSTVFGKDLHASTVALGRALEDPVNGLTALRRAGVEFSPTEKEVLKNLVETGQAAEAQRIILDKLEGKMAGTGAAEATGLTGAAHQVAISWKNMLEAIGQTPAVAGTAEAAMQALAGIFKSATGLIKTPSASEQLIEAKQQLLEAQQVLERLQNYNPRVMTDMTPLIDRQKDKIAELRQEVDSLTVSAQHEAEADAAEKAKALARQQAAQKEQRAELLIDQRKKLDDAIAKLVDDPSEKIAKINDELGKTKQRIEALREKDNSNGSDIDAAITQAEELARRQTEAVQKPINEAAQKAAEANQKVIDDLKRQLLGFGDARQAFIDQAVSRLSEKAGEAEKARTRALAGEVFDQKTLSDTKKVLDDLTRQIEKTTDKKQAFVDEYLSRLPKGATQDEIDQTKKLAAVTYDQIQAREKLEKLKEEGKQLTDSDKSATAAYTDQIAHLTEMLNAGAISQEVFNKAKNKADDALLAGRTDPAAGAIRAFHSYQKSAEDSADAVEKAFSDAMKATEDSIVNMVTKGEISLNSLNDLANSIVADITRMFVQQSITGPLFKAMGSSLEGGGFLSDIFGSLFHEGGTVGSPAPARQVPAFVFAGAPRYHSGGIAGLRPDEVPAILQRGETVLPKNARTGSPINVVMQISTPDANSFRASQSQLSAEAARGISRARRNL